MCYDISFTVDIKQLSDYFPDMVFDDQIKINFEPVHIMGHAYGLHPVIYRPKEGNAIHCRLSEWGCIPFYVKDEDQFKKQRATMLNARSERVLDDPKSYWYKIRNRRCLKPMTGFYEHREVKGEKKKVPYYIELKDQATFFVPGLFSVVELVDKTSGEMQKRFTHMIITTSANNVMMQIHNGGENAGRMPLLLPMELSQKWLQEDLEENEYREILNYKIPDATLKFHTVDTIRSPKPRPDGKPKNEFYDWGSNVPEIII